MAAYKPLKTEVVIFLALSVIGVVFPANVLILAVSQAEDLLLAQARHFFQPLPKDIATPELPITAELAELGRGLFLIHAYRWMAQLAGPVAINPPFAALTLCRNLLELKTGPIQEMLRAS